MGVVVWIKMAEGDSIFSKIIRKEIPSEFLHEDDQVMHFAHVFDVVT